MILSNSEIVEITSIMKSYKELHDSLNLYEKKLEGFTSSGEKDPAYILDLGSKIRNCISKLTEERERENNLSKMLEEKYGPGDLDVNTLEYKVKNF